MEFLHNKLLEREREGTLRRLTEAVEGIDFFSNDYIGASRSVEIKNRTCEILNLEGLEQVNGSTGSRLISGNLPFYEKVEAFLAEHFHSESALVYGSGYAASLGLLSCLGTGADTILYDQYVHASARDGIRLGRAKSYSFRHNDLEDLEAKIKKASGQVFVVTESLFSMDGDFSPLEDIIRLKERYGFVLILDEAHTAGIYGEKGRGMASEWAFEENLIRIVTFGKAFGSEGAAILGSNRLKEYLVNFSRPFIYSTAPAPHFFASVRASVEWVRKAEEARKKLLENIRFYRNVRPEANSSPIQTIMGLKISQLRRIAFIMEESGILVKPIFPPTVPQGKERIRIVLHAFNSPEQISLLISLLNSVEN